MKTTMLIAGGLALSLLGTGCATKKYVAKTVEPVAQRVSAVESKNADQDKQIASNASQIENVDRDLSRTKERLNDVEQKATAAGDAAKAADAKASQATTAANTAEQDAQQGIRRATQVGNSLDSFTNDYKAGKVKMIKDDSVLFGLNQYTLTDEAKAQLDSLAGSFNGLGRYMVEIQGFTDKTGSPAYNEVLSQQRADSVARYLASKHHVPLRNITVLGTGVAEGDMKTREERKQARKVEVRVLVPDFSATTTAER
jgi:outer membrane protein OmpA-like peptidoglycan-associated protein